MDRPDATPPRPATPAIDEATSYRTSVVVRAPIDHAFRVFTADMSSWWPKTHHIGQAPLVATIVEPRAGGRWYEMGDDGSTCDWGVVLAWEPPAHVALSWHLDGDFAYDPSDARSSRVDVRFAALADGTTHVELVHSGLDRHGDSWKRLLAGIGAPGGWPEIVGSFARRAEQDAR